MARPINPVIFVAENNVNLPSTGEANKSEPSNTIQTIGFDADQVVTAENLNYILSNFSEWIRYVDETLEQRKIPVGGIIELTGDDTNPSQLLGYGIWEEFGSGLTTVGVGTYTDDRGETKTWVDGQTEGEYQHVQTENELAQHLHLFSGNTDQDGVHSHNLPLVNADTSGDGNNVDSSDETVVVGNKETDTAGAHSHSFSGSTDNTGSSSPMNNTQPSIAVYKWKRIL